MPYVAIGILGFLVGYLFDVVSLQRTRWAKPALWVMHSALIAYSMVMLAVRSKRIRLPRWLTFVGGAVFCPSVFLELYSLFINLPFRKTYVADEPERKLVKTGTYALVRHPSVLWFGPNLISLILVSRSKLLLLTSPLWIALDVLWVVLQERFIFTKIFEGYDEYKRETPMLIPNRKSTRAFISSLRQPRKEEANARGS